MEFRLLLQEEKHRSGIYLDPNKDFPWNIKNGKCLISSTARAINYLFQKYLIQATLTFHSGEQSISLNFVLKMIIIIGYPCGSFNQTLNKCVELPDEKAFLG